MWGHGAKHTWIGKIKYQGYIFESDSKEPLQFKVDNDLGYIYLAGKGTVTFPDGHQVILP
jgi:hypothetical protein